MEKHEIVYRELKSLGYKGWGGRNYDNRMAGWDQQLVKLSSLTGVHGGEVLELGCGAGDVSLRLSRMGHQVTGVDISETAIAWATEKVREADASVDLHQGNVCDQNLLKGRKFDLIVDGNCLHCLFQTDRIAFYNNLKRLVKKGGYVFLSTAIVEEEGKASPRISSIDRCFVTREKIEYDMSLSGFEVVSEWFSEGTHLHYYGLYTTKAVEER